ncbi:AcrR family transcriptional regulator [Lipingzhangella halophila]|uniref:AcrR family transcriptional regulator n=1 Tax=Lipingzhangella halophila TaxID=1783352 RepID=A0A7W7W2U0_9ACTN|nr:TetR/AcrR family transcriptional regulator [Lipingzhangella halophila]MBB4932322.1 AcrR family transcriptional regulator [Lipingzhangella halophila]
MPAEDERFPSVWTRPPRRRREQPTLSREQIVSEAVRLLDAEGIDALSMRRLGARLGAVATSIYWHVANKDELVELVVDEVFGEARVPAADDPAHWREAVSDCARSLRAVILRHPWISSLHGQIGLAYLGPNLVRLSEGILAVFETAGLSSKEAEQAMKAVTTYASGAATSEAAYLSAHARSGRNEQDWLESLRPATEQAVRDHPRLRARYAEQHGEDPARTREENFDYGLARLLDGIRTRLGSADGSSG